MRRAALLPLLIAVLTIAGCSAGSTTKRTVTVVATMTSAAPASTSKTTGGVVVGSPSAPAKTVPSSTAPVTSPPPKTTAAASAAAPIVKVNPLQAECANILDYTDIKKAIGTTVGENSNLIRLGAGAHGVTGAIRCLYGSKDGGKTAPVRIRLTQFGTAAAAQAQVQVDAQTAQDANAVMGKPTVDGYPASLQLVAGGLIEMAYSSWTLSVAVSDKLATNAQLTKGLPQLAGLVLERITKTG